MPDVQCAKFNNLVYARTLKAGSEFFYKNFIQTMGWRPWKLSDVNWEHDIVFSYIMDPIQRRHKGVSEVIIQLDARELMLKNKSNFHNIVKQIPFIDSHSASLHNIYGNKVNKINWLLMTNDHQVAIAETERFLQQHGYTMPITWDVNYTHATGAYMSEIFVKVKSLWENDPSYDDSVRHYFAQDIELYNKVKEEYHARNHGSQHS